MATVGCSTSRSTVGCSTPSTFEISVFIRSACVRRTPRASPYTRTTSGCRPVPVRTSRAALRVDRAARPRADPGPAGAGTGVPPGRLSGARMSHPEPGAYTGPPPTGPYGAPPAVHGIAPGWPAHGVQSYGPPGYGPPGYGP